MLTFAPQSLAGGQGKTTLALMVARLLAEAGHSTVLIDADPQHNLTLFIGHRAKKNAPTLLEVLNGSVDILDGIYKTEFPNLYLIPSDRPLGIVQDYLSSSGVGALMLRNRLKAVADKFEFCVIDVPPQGYQLCLTTIGAADALALPVECSPKGVESLITTLDLIETKKSQGVFSGLMLGAMPFRDKWVGYRRTQESRDSVDAMTAIVGPELMLPTVRESEQVKKAINRRQTLRDLGHVDLQYPFEMVVEKLLQLAGVSQPVAIEGVVR